MCNKDYSLSKEAHSTVPQLQCKQSCVSIWTWTPKAFVPLQGTQSTDSYTLINITISHFKGPGYHTWINSLAHLPQDARQDIHSSESRWHKKHRSLSLSLSLSLPILERSPGIEQLCMYTHAQPCMSFSTWQPKPLQQYKAAKHQLTHTHTHTST